MAKRFTDTDKWKKPFFKKLKVQHKLLWFYILDDCDHAGIWHVDLEVVSLRVGEEINEKEALEDFGENIIQFDNGDKWFIPDFVEFQYGELKETNRVHESVIKKLNKYGLYKPLASPLQRAKDKEEDIDIDKDKDEDIDNSEFDKFWDLYDYKKGKKEDVCKAFNKLPEEDKALIMVYIPKYIASTPDKQYRKYPSSFLNQKGWLDEISVKKTASARSTNPGYNGIL